VVDRPRVVLLADPTVERTDIRVDARFAEGGRRAQRARSRGAQSRTTTAID
jgi:hypothetical protein